MVCVYRRYGREVFPQAGNELARKDRGGGIGYQWLESLIRRQEKKKAIQKSAVTVKSVSNLQKSIAAKQKKYPGDKAAAVISKEAQEDATSNRGNVKIQEEDVRIRRATES